MLTLVLGEEGLTMVPAVAKTEGSILQKVSRKQKLTSDKFREAETVAKKQQKTLFMENQHCRETVAIRNHC